MSREQKTPRRFEVGDTIMLAGGTSYAAKKGARAFVTRATYRKGYMWLVDIIWMDRVAGSQRDGGYSPGDFHPVAKILPFRRRSRPHVVQQVAQEFQQLELL